MTFTTTKHGDFYGRIIRVDPAPPCPECGYPLGRVPDRPQQYVCFTCHWEGTWTR